MRIPSIRAPLPEIRPWGAPDTLLRRAVTATRRLLRDASRAPAADGPAIDPATVAAGPSPLPAGPAPADPALARAAWSHRLWGDGMVWPGGAEEILRLAALLPLTASHTLLVAGYGARMAGAVITGARGCFVSAHDLVPVPADRRGLPKRVSAATMVPGATAFRPAYHQHALLLEPFRAGGAADATLRAAAAALRDGGELVLLDLVTRDGAPDRRWLAAERRHAPPAGAAMQAALERAGFRIHVVEDASARHERAVMLGWVALIEALRGEARQQSPLAAAALVAEAEAWLLRLRLLRDGRLRLLRWHAGLVRRPG